MATTESEFAAWVGAPEGTQLEFKTARERYDFDKLLKYCVALANEGGGKIILGVTDARPRQVTGTAAFAEPGRTEAGLHQQLGQRIPVEEYHYNGQRVLIFHVPGRLPGTPWSHDGRYYKRAGDELVPMPEAELRSIYSEVAPDFTAETCDATLSDLSDDALTHFRASWSRRAPHLRLEAKSPAELLADAELIVDGHLTRAALILFGTRPTLGRHLPQAEIVFEYRSSDASGPAQDREEYRLGFFSVFDQLWKKINLRNDRQSYQDDFFRYDIPTFDEVPIREAILNAIAHREYRQTGSIFVRQYPRRLEIISPGGLPLGITPENIVDRQNPRNRRLAEALAKAGLVERSGQGLNLMVETAIRQTKPLPSFSGSSAHEVHLTLAGTVQNPAFIRFLQRLGDERLATFSTYDYLALDAIQRDLPLTPAQAERLPILIESGAVETIGRGKGRRHFLSRELYAAMGSPGAYTRRKGLDHETNKALLMRHLQDHAKDGAPKRDLVQVLPSLSASSIQRLLDELREENYVQIRGERRWSRWYPLKPYAPASIKNDP